MKNKGYYYAIAAHVLWGILPFYWKLLDHLSALEVITARTLFSALTLLLLVHAIRQTPYQSYLKNRKTLLGLTLTGILIAINWGTFIYAVNSDQVLQSSIGYYLGPLVTVLLGVIVFKEKLSFLQYLAFAVVTLSIVFLIISYESASWISFTLAISFSTYGFLKKKFHLDSLNSLMLETFLVLPFVFLVLGISWSSTPSTLGTSTWWEWILIVLTGVVTFVPLVLFAEGTKRLPLTVVGYLQYITPTLFMLSGIFIYQEPFNEVEFITFLLIWVGLALNFYAMHRQSKLSAR